MYIFLLFRFLVRDPSYNQNEVVIMYVIII